MASKKLILVLGATGAQGKHVVSALLAPAEDGTPSPYAVRALTRDPDNYRAKELAALGCEIFKGTFMNLADIKAAYEGCYGVFVNTDTQQVGEQNDIYWSIKLFEWAKRTPTLHHFVYSGLDYSSKLGGYNPIYQAVHFDAKGIFFDWLKSQDSDESLRWTNIATGPYMEMLKYPMYGPLNKRADGTVVFASPIGDGHVPLVALDDIAWFVRYSLDHPKESSGQDFKIASEWIQWDTLVETFTRVTGIPSVYKRLSVEEWLSCLRGNAGNEQKEREMEQHFSGMMCMYRDDIVKRDMEWIRKINPTGYTLEKWIRENNYKGEIGSNELKKGEDGKSRLTPNRAKCSQL